MKYTNFKRYKFSTVTKKLNTLRHGFLKIFKLVDFKRYDFKNIFKYIDIKKVINSAALKFKHEVKTGKYPTKKYSY